MALTLIKEDGTGKADANSYADAADADAYFEGHLYATAWAGATGDQKEAALVFATRLIDAAYQFDGVKAVEGQALQWPRMYCPDPDGNVTAMVASDAVPKAMIDATCEMARELLIADRTAAHPGEGIRERQEADLTKTIYDKADTRPMISRLAQAMLAKYGTPVAGGKSAVPLIRV